jgi:hypothetical protein
MTCKLGTVQSCLGLAAIPLFVLSSSPLNCNLSLTHAFASLTTPLPPHLPWPTPRNRPVNKTSHSNMAWFALSFKCPIIWHTSPSALAPVLRQPPQKHNNTVSVPSTPYGKVTTICRLPTRPADIYTVRIFNPSTQPGLFGKLRNEVEERGGSVLVELGEGRGLM